MNGMARESSLTELIHRAERGDVDAADQLFTAMYGDLRRLARARLRGGGRNTLLDTSSLVHESYLRYAGAGQLHLHRPSVRCAHLQGHAIAGAIIDVQAGQR